MQIFRQRDLSVRFRFGIVRLFRSDRPVADVSERIPFDSTVLKSHAVRNVQSTLRYASQPDDELERRPAASPKASFPPLWRADATLLIVGSLPGEVSLSRRQYYAHPRNQFWPLITAVIDGDLGARYESRLVALSSAKVALWDVVESARRTGSLDSAVRAISPNDLSGLMRKMSRLRAIGFNGKLAARYGLRLIPQNDHIQRIVLPSSSPALTTPFDVKLEAWLALRSFVRTADRDPPGSGTIGSVKAICRRPEKA